MREAEFEIAKGIAEGSSLLLTVDPLHPDTQLLPMWYKQAFRAGICLAHSPLRDVRLTGDTHEHPEQNKQGIVGNRVRLSYCIIFPFQLPRVGPRYALFE